MAPSSDFPILPEFRTWGIYLDSTVSVWPEAHLGLNGTSLLSCVRSSNRDSLPLTRVVAPLLHQLAFPWCRLSRHGSSFLLILVYLCLCAILPPGGPTRRFVARLRNNLFSSCPRARLICLATSSPLLFLQVCSPWLYLRSRKCFCSWVNRTFLRLDVKRVVKGGGGEGGRDHVSRKIEWSFHKLREIKSAFHVSRKKKVIFLHELAYLMIFEKYAHLQPC